MATQIDLLNGIDKKLRTLNQILCCQNSGGGDGPSSRVSITNDCENPAGVEICSATGITDLLTTINESLNNIEIKADNISLDADSIDLNTDELEALLTSIKTTTDSMLTIMQRQYNNVSYMTLNSGDHFEIGTPGNNSYHSVSFVVLKGSLAMSGSETPDAVTFPEGYSSTDEFTTICGSTYYFDAGTDSQIILKFIY